MTNIFLKDELMWLILISSKVDLSIVKEYQKWACVCKTWSNAHGIWVDHKYKIALEEARFFADFTIDQCHAKRDTQSIVRGLAKNMWHDVSGISCMRKIQIFLSRTNEFDSDDELIVDSDDDDGSVLIDDFIGNDGNQINDVFVSTYSYGANQYDDYHQSINEIGTAVKAIEDHDFNNHMHCETNLSTSVEKLIPLKYDDVTITNQNNCILSTEDTKAINDYMLRKEEQVLVRHVLSLSLLEKLDDKRYITEYMMIDHAYNVFIENLTSDSKYEEVPNIEAFFESYIFDDIILSVTHGPKNEAFIDAMSRTELVDVCINIVETLGTKCENSTICSFAVRVLKTMFSHQSCRTQISSGRCLRGLISMTKISTRKYDMISSSLLIMAICESNHLVIIEFLERGGLKLLINISKINSSLAISFMICNFIFKVCTNNHLGKSVLVVESCVVHFLTDSVIQFISSEAFIHGVCKILLFLSSNIENRIQLRKNGCIQILEKMRTRYTDNALIQFYSSTIQARIHYTIV